MAIPGFSQAVRAPAFGIAVLAPVLLTSAVAASPERAAVSASAPVATATAPAVPAPAAPGRSAGPDGGLRIAPIALSAHRKAEQTMATAQPGCGVSWNVLAAVGRIESSASHENPAAMRSVAVKAAGPKTPGPKKPPSATWSRFASDGDGDGKSDPRNMFDATLATARHLCSSGLDFHNHAQLLTALLRYNSSLAFAENVLGWAEAYASGSVPINLPPIHGSVPVLGPHLPSRTWGEPQTPLVLGTSTQAIQMLPEPGPELLNTAPPVVTSAPEPWMEPPPATVAPGPAVVPTPDVGPAAVPAPVAPHWDHQRATPSNPEPTQTFIEPQLPAESNVGDLGGGRQGGRTQGARQPEPPAPTAGSNDGGDGGSSGGGGRRGRRGDG